jgi:hypothetical protein
LGVDQSLSTAFEYLSGKKREKQLKIAHILEGKELAILNRGGIVTINSEHGEIHLAARVDPTYERQVRQAARARRAKGRKRK